MTETLFVLRYGSGQGALLNTVRELLARQCPNASVEWVEAGAPVGERHAELLYAVRSTRKVVMIDLDDPQRTPEQIVSRVKCWCS